MRILVTGGAGFIGSCTARLLCQAGHQVTIIDDLSFGHRHLVPEPAELLVGSCDDASLLEAVLPRTDAVMHFAASSIIQFAIERPLEYVHNNVTRGVRLLEAMRRFGVKRIVFSSSASVYGEPARVPIEEDDPKHPTQAYGASKLAFEAMLSAYSHSYGLHSTSFRYFNAYGPGDEQVPVTRAVPRWIKAALRHEPLVLYWGGRQVRDYVYVEDIARAHILALALDGCRQYNLGSGKGIVMADLAQAIITATGSTSPIVDGGERPGDPSRLVASIERVRRDLGWTPRIGLEEGLARTVAYYQTTVH